MQLWSGKLIDRNKYFFISDVYDSQNSSHWKYQSGCNKLLIRLFLFDVSIISISYPQIHRADSEVLYKSRKPYFWFPCSVLPISFYSAPLNLVRDFSSEVWIHHSLPRHSLILLMTRLAYEVLLYHIVARCGSICGD